MSLLNDTLRNLERRNAGDPLPHAAAPPPDRHRRRHSRWRAPLVAGVLITAVVGAGLHYLVPPEPRGSGPSGHVAPAASPSPGLPWTPQYPGTGLARPSLLGPLEDFVAAPAVADLPAPEPLRVTATDPPATPPPASAQVPEPDATTESAPDGGTAADEPVVDAAEHPTADAHPSPTEATAPRSGETREPAPRSGDTLAAPTEAPPGEIERRTATPAEQATALYQRARQLQAERQWRPSTGLLEQALGHDPGHIQARLALADALTRIGRETAAGRALDAGLEHAPGEPALVRARTRLYLRQQDAEAALRLLERTPANDREPASRALLARALQHANRHAEASRHYHELLQDDPSGRHWLALAHSLEHLGQPGEARAAYRRALEHGDLGPASRRHAETRHRELAGPR